MDDDFWKRHLEDSQRVARWADPLREFKDLLGTPFSTQKQIEALYRDPLSDIRDQMKALTDPRDQQAAWLKENYAQQLKELTDPYNFGADQFTAAYAQPTIAEHMRALTDPNNLAAGQVPAWLKEDYGQDAFAKHLKELTDTYNLADQVPAWLKEDHGQEAFAKHLKDLADPYNLIADQLKAAYGQPTIAEHIQALLEPFDGAKAWVNAYRDEQERLRQWSTMFDDFARQVEVLPDEVRAQLAVLMEQGWCLDPEMPHTWGQDLAAAFQQGEHDEAQQWLIDYFKERLDEIEKALVERHPERGAIIADAFQAQREGRYYLSIPVLLAQADGVIHDRHQRQLFSKKRTANLMEVLSGLPEDDMRAIFIAAFYVDIPLTRKTQLLPEGFNGLNRHAVLHGTDPSYGTEINSLRAVSILNLASYMVSEEEES